MSHRVSHVADGSLSLITNEARAITNVPPPPPRKTLGHDPNMKMISSPRARGEALGRLGPSRIQLIPPPSPPRQTMSHRVSHVADGSLSLITNEARAIINAPAPPPRKTLGHDPNMKMNSSPRARGEALKRLGPSSPIIFPTSCRSLRKVPSTTTSTQSHHNDSLRQNSDSNMADVTAIISRYRDRLVKLKYTSDDESIHQESQYQQHMKRVLTVRSGGGRERRNLGHQQQISNKQISKEKYDEYNPQDSDCSSCITDESSSDDENSITSILDIKDNGEQHRLLTKRTSQLMANLQDFISEIDYL